MSSPSKKRRSDVTYDEVPYKKANVTEKHSNVVAEHYNRKGNTSCAERRNSKIYYMRNFNNWIKSVLIRKYQEKLAKEINCLEPIVLDLGVGKGGDLLKWDKGHIKKLICTDIAATSIDQCRDRYSSLKRKAKNRRVFDVEFIVVDLGRESLLQKLAEPQVDHHISTCQFVIHYAFESKDQAEKIVQNACSSLCDGGYFIGTTTNDAKLIHNARLSPDLKFGNEVYSVQFQGEEPFAEFGCKYIFKLHDVVDCPEFLLQKHTLIRLCRKYGMKLVEWKPFAQFFEENKENKDNFRLIRKMQALEVYDLRMDANNLNSSKSGDYLHAENECRRIVSINSRADPKVATLSKTEWDAASLYVVFVFIKDENNVRDIKAEEESGIEKIPLVIL